MPKSNQKADSLMRTGKSEEPLGCVIPEPPESLQKQELAEFQEVKIPGNQKNACMIMRARMNLENKLQILGKFPLRT